MHFFCGSPLYVKGILHPLPPAVPLIVLIKHGSAGAGTGTNAAVGADVGLSVGIFVGANVGICPTTVGLTVGAEVGLFGQAQMH
jgi:hypothetical protein